MSLQNGGKYTVVLYLGSSFIFESAAMCLSQNRYFSLLDFNNMILGLSLLPSN